jgi:hypothetical protein
MASIPIRRPLLIAAALLLSGAARMAAAQQVELHLSSGQVVKGEVIAQDDTEVRVKSAIATKTGTMSVTMGYKREQILSIVTLADPEADFAKRAAAAKSADEHAALAAWCRDQAMPDRAAAQAQEALAQTADQPVALALLKDLGWVQVDGKWVKESEALAAQGKVRYQGQVMTIAEADALKEKAKEGAAHDNARKDVEGKAAYIATIDKQLADLQKRPALLDAELAKASTALSAAQAKAQKVTQAKSAYDSAQRSLTQAQNQNTGQRQGGNGTAGNANTVNLQPLYQAVEDARKAYAQARADADGAEGEVTRQQGVVASLNEEKKNLEHKKTDLTARRVRAVKDLETAQATLAKQGGAAPAPAVAPAPAAAKP